MHSWRLQCKQLGNDSTVCGQCFPPELVSPLRKRHTADTLRPAKWLLSKVLGYVPALSVVSRSAASSCGRLLRIQPLRTKCAGVGSPKDEGTAEALGGIEVDYTSSKPGSRSAFWSNVSVRVHPARAPSSAINASANDPRSRFSATMAVGCTKRDNLVLVLNRPIIP
jgi:hypothetical protein